MVSPPVRMSDVARMAGVARVTVSRVLSEPDSVAPATREAVQAAIQALGYVPNLNAGALASRRSRIVGALVPTLSNAWFADTLDGLTETLDAQGYQLLLGQTRYDPRTEQKLVDAFLGRGVDALVLTGTERPEALRQQLRRAAIPVVECWDLCDDPIDTVVGFSNVHAGRAAADYLLARGRRHLAFVGADEPRSNKRLQGFTEAVQAWPGAAPVQVRRVRPPSSLRDGVSSMASLLSDTPRLDALFCSNDTLALGALACCRQQGLAVPDQVGVLGFSDLPLAELSVPALSSLHIDSRRMGQRVGEVVAARLTRQPRQPDDQRLDLGFSIIERQSA